MNNNVINQSILGKILNKYSKIEYDNKHLYLFTTNEKKENISWARATSFVEIDSGIFSSSIEFTFDLIPLKINFLNKSDCQKAFSIINGFIKSIIDELVTTKKNTLIKYAQLEYLRDSTISTLEDELLPLFKSYNKQRENWDKNLSTESLKFLNDYSEYFPLNKHSIKQLREEFESKILNARSSFYDKIESNPLTEEQRLAVIRDNDRNLVLAAAGTGKTSVMVAKALDIIDRGIAKAENILILAYNKDAANELQERLNLRGKEIFSDEDIKPQIQTFHALGREILIKAKQSVKISVFSEKPETLEKWLSEWFVTKMQSDDKLMENFIKLNYQPINPFDFKSKAEYDNYIRDNDYITLQGEYVRGYQELLIANWLFINGIEYEYEPSYISKQRIEVGFDYRPDFFLTDYNIYLEHFGIDRLGNTRADINKIKYNQEIQQKRELHNRFNTKLIETYHYNWTEGNLESTLLQHTIDNNILINKRSLDEIFNNLNKTEFLVNGIKRYLKCLQAIRVERLSEVDVYARLEKDKVKNSKEYTELLSSIHRAYIEELKKQDSIDFDDMIIRAITEVNNKNFKPYWTHILVDEFQDISAARMEFLNSLIKNGPTPRLTAVGDDWQSIYRFSGGKLELTTQFESLVGSCTTTMLQKTFRYNNSIAFTAGAFVMKNPEQYKKDVITHTKVDLSQVYLLDSQVSNVENFELKTVKVIEEIIRNEPNASIAVIARYRYLLTETKKVVSKYIQKKEIKYWTFHGSKGLEADYCILIGFFQGKTGFPNENKEEAVVEALLPSLDTFKHSEERRLLYVGITRAKKKCYLIADPKATSEFVSELLTPKFELNISSKSFDEQYREIFKCNVCTTGYYKLKKGEFGDFYSCTSGKSCKSKPRICTKCGSPSIDYKEESICSNKNCSFVMKICDVCGRPMKQRNGKFGPFWGCSGYGLEKDPCNNTKKI